MTDAELIAELVDLLRNSKTRHTDPALRANWSLRKQAAIALASTRVALKPSGEVT